MKFLSKFAHKLIIKSPDDFKSPGPSYLNIATSFDVFLMESNHNYYNLVKIAFFLAAF